MIPNHRATARDPKARVVVCAECEWPLEWRQKIGDWWHTLRSGILIEYVIIRDGSACWLCGDPVHRLVASLDHLRPDAHGGTLDPENLRLAHQVCNVARGDLPYRQTVAVGLGTGPERTRALLRSALRSWSER